MAPGFSNDWATALRWRGVPPDRVGLPQPLTNVVSGVTAWFWGNSREFLPDWEIEALSRRDLESQPCLNLAEPVMSFFTPRRLAPPALAPRGGERVQRLGDAAGCPDVLASADVRPPAGAAAACASGRARPPFASPGEVPARDEGSQRPVHDAERVPMDAQATEPCEPAEPTTASEAAATPAARAKTRQGRSRAQPTGDGRHRGP